MNRNEFAAWAGVNQQVVDDWIVEGLPIVDGKIDADAAAAWIEKAGYGVREGHNGVVKTLDEVAAAFNVRPQTVRTWRLNNMPGSKGRWDVAEIRRWKTLREKDPVALNGARRKQLEKLDATIRIAKADATAKERTNQLASRRLVDRDDATREVSEFFVELKADLERIPREMMPRYPAALANELTAELRNRIHRVMDKAAGWAITVKAAEK